MSFAGNQIIFFKLLSRYKRELHREKAIYSFLCVPLCASVKLRVPVLAFPKPVCRSKYPHLVLQTTSMVVMC